MSVKFEFSFDFDYVLTEEKLSELIKAFFEKGFLFYKYDSKLKEEVEGVKGECVFYDYELEDFANLSFDEAVKRAVKVGGSFGMSSFKLGFGFDLMVFRYSISGTCSYSIIVEKNKQHLLAIFKTIIKVLKPFKGQADFASFGAKEEEQWFLYYSNEEIKKRGGNFLVGLKEYEQEKLENGVLLIDKTRKYVKSF